MTREEIENGNKLISIFACNKKADGTIDSNTIGGYPEGTMHFSLERCPINTMYPFNHKYAYYCAGEWNSNWSWLMPVLKKIQSIYETDKSFGVLIDISTTHVRISSGDFICTIGKTDENWVPFDISNVYLAVVEFIKWYNENEKIKV
jgi:hypothetical protein